VYGLPISCSATGAGLHVDSDVLGYVLDLERSEMGLVSERSEFLNLFDVCSL